MFVLSGLLVGQPFFGDSTGLWKNSDSGSLMFSTATILSNWIFHHPQCRMDPQTFKANLFPSSSAVSRPSDHFPSHTLCVTQGSCLQYKSTKSLNRLFPVFVMAIFTYFVGVYSNWANLFIA